MGHFADLQIVTDFREAITASVFSFQEVLKTLEHSVLKTAATNFSDTCVNSMDRGGVVSQNA